jgi:hypothetical protein
MANPQEEVMDILNLTRTVNTDIQEFNRTTSNDSRNLRANLIDPKKAAADLLSKVTSSTINNTPMVQPIQQIRTLDGYSVSAPRPLIPLPEGVSMPSPMPPPLPQQLPPPLPQTINTQPEQMSKNVQLELPLDINGKRYSNTIEYFEERYDRIEAKFDIINAKLTELLSRTKRRYERKPTTEKLD